VTATTGSSSRPTIILDCDPGLDDAVAIAMALSLTDVVGITTVGGNVGVDMTTRNALVVCELLGRTDVPVHAGHDEPFAGTSLQRAADVHGPNGMGDTELPEPSRRASDTDAVDAILAASEEHDDLWLVATGPLTNLAHAVTVDPKLPQRVVGLSWMGGSHTNGNVTAAAEFNAWADPEAMNVVFDAGFDQLLMHGLGVTHTVLLDDLWIDRLGAGGESGDELAATFASLLRFYRDRQAERVSLDGAAVHDALAVLHPARPDLFSFERHRVEAIVDGAARGMTLIDQRPLPDPAAGNVDVVLSADADAIRDIMWTALTSHCDA